MAPSKKVVGAEADMGAAQPSGKRSLRSKAAVSITKPDPPSRKPRRTKEEIAAAKEEERKKKEEKQAKIVQKAAIAAEEKRIAEKLKKQIEKEREKKLKKLHELEQEMDDEAAGKKIRTRYKTKKTNKFGSGRSSETPVDNDVSESNAGTESVDDDKALEVISVDDSSYEELGERSLSGTGNSTVTIRASSTPTSRKASGGIATPRAQPSKMSMRVIPPSDDLVVSEDPQSSEDVDMLEAPAKTQKLALKSDAKMSNMDTTNGAAKRKLSNDLRVTINGTTGEVGTVKKLKTEGSAITESSANWRENVRKARAFLSPAENGICSRSVSPTGSTCSNSVYAIFRETSVDPSVCSEDDRRQQKPVTARTYDRKTSSTVVQIVDGATTPAVREKSALLQPKREKSNPEDNKLMVATKKFTMKDIKVDYTTFRYVFVPTYCDLLMTQENPFKTRELQILEGMQAIWDIIFPLRKEKLTMDCPIKLIGDQRFYEFRRRFSEVANKSVAKFFKEMQADNPLYDDEWRRGYVERALKNSNNPGFLWRTFPIHVDETEEDKWVYSGVFQSRLVLEVFAFHLYETRTMIQDAPAAKADLKPIGALAITGCSVERALRQWSSGSFEETKLQFSGDNYSKRLAVYVAIAKNLETSQWRRILDMATDIMSMHASSRSNGSQSDILVYDLTGDDSDVVNPADVAALDKDLDLDDA